MTIRIEKTYPPKLYEHFEKKYNAKFICEHCLNTKMGWTNFPVLFFYAEEKHLVSNSNYFAIYKNEFTDKWIIKSGQEIVGRDIPAIIANNGDIIYSRFRHDYQESKDESVIIDGGMDYIRTSGQEIIYLNVIGDELVVKD